MVGKTLWTSSLLVLLAGCTAPVSDDGEIVGQTSDALGSDRTEGGTATAQGTPCNTTTETPDKAYDNLMTSSSFSKWCVSSAPSTITPISTMYDFSGSTSYPIISYTITTSNDGASRDPKDWTFQGCQGTCVVDSGTGWVTLDTRTGQFAGAARYQTNTYNFTNSTAYQQYRLRITANNGDTARLQMAELQMFDSGGISERTEGGSSAAQGTPCTTTSETVDKAYDNLMTSGSFSKWCVTSAPTSTTPISTMYDFAGSASYAITTYAITTGNDGPNRDPKEWRFQGCQGTCVVDSGTGWVTLDTRSNQFAGAARYQTNTYTFTNSTAYQQYRLRMTANNGDTARTQLAEIQMFDIGTSEFCSGVPTWSPSIIYNTGDRVVRDGHLYECNYWADNIDPAVRSNVAGGYEWLYKGVCSGAVIGSGIGSVIPEAMYNAIYRGGDVAFYTYAGLTATASLTEFCSSTNLTLRKREAAAFLANVWQETQGLVYKEEVDKSNDYCCPAGETRNGTVCPTYGCPAPIPANATSAYFGRGAIQLTWNYNYKPAGDYVGLDLLNHPEYVLNPGGAIAWKTSVWYWMVQNGPNTQTAHSGIMLSNGTGGFGETIKSINGYYECPSLGGNGSYTAQRDNRIAKYKLYCDLLHVSYGNNTSC